MFVVHTQELSAVVGEPLAQLDERDGVDSPRDGSRDTAQGVGTVELLLGGFFITDVHVVGVGDQALLGLVLVDDRVITFHRGHGAILFLDLNGSLGVASNFSSHDGEGKLRWETNAGEGEEGKCRGEGWGEKRERCKRGEDNKTL